MKVILTTSELHDPCSSVSTRIFGVPLIVRVIREYNRAGFTPIIVSPCDDIKYTLERHNVSAHVGRWPHVADTDVLIARADVLIDAGALSNIAQSRGNTAYLVGEEVVALKLTGALVGELGEHSLHTAPSSLYRLIAEKRSVEPSTVTLFEKDAAIFGDGRSLERWLLRKAQKGVHFTSKLNAPVENLIVRLVGKFPWVTPNRVTLLVNVLAILPLIYFYYGHILIGSLLAYFIGILDGVDGKLARVRGVSTKLGLLEHSLDTLYELAWYASFTLGYYRLTWDTTALVLGFMLLTINSYLKHVYLQFELATGKPLKTLFRTFSRIDGRRNVYILYFIISSILGVPVLGILLSLVHATVTAIVYTVQSTRHLRLLD
ncbi:CDP-alcohol phosphatidyltransferase family protein [Infirmifilum lucidum]|uniref:CDP-alcohol phosphatidyltransferase family protein n=1 Tax=Infirmifilum lucidum TaxID=2776706 RepID=A0A7L9FGJ1_9CREN|nr:CDP-alcohol phosphatidyltransferase family protein [Infirmifilum lucidum]QOJ78879.1 CDP-alcohol phosphatidyltransferase family protein [Infirmifilum lucidum]